MKYKDYKGERKLNLHYDEIVIGCSLAALLYCHFRNRPFIYTEIMKPGIYENYESIPLRNFWEKLMILSSFLGRNIFSDQISNIDVVDTNNLTFQTKDFTSYNVSFKKLVIFDTNNVTGIQLGQEKIMYEVFDYFRVSMGDNDFKEHFDKTNEFVYHTMLAFPYGDFRHYLRILSISKLNEDELEDPSFNHSVALIKAKRAMKEVGVKGRTSKQTKKVKYEEDGVKKLRYEYFTFSRPLEVKPKLRLTRRLNCKSTPDTETIKFISLTPQEVFIKHSRRIRSIYNKIIKSMFGKNREKIIRRARGRIAEIDRI